MAMDTFNVGFHVNLYYFYLRNSKGVLPCIFRSMAAITGVTPQTLLAVMEEVVRCRSQGTCK